MNGLNFTERVRAILKLAVDSVATRKHEAVRTEHILLAVITEGEGVGVATLQNVGIDLSNLVAQLERHLPSGSSELPAGLDAPFTQGAKKVLELAMAEAVELDHSYVGSEHLVLGLLGEKKGVAAQLLTDAGATQNILRSEVRRLLGDGAPAAHVDNPESITSITVAVERADGSRVEKEFVRVVAALQYLRQVGHVAAREMDS